MHEQLGASGCQRLTPFSVSWERMEQLSYHRTLKYKQMALLVLQLYCLLCDPGLQAWLLQAFLPTPRLRVARDISSSAPCLADPLLSSPGWSQTRHGSGPLDWDWASCGPNQRGRISILNSLRAAPTHRQRYRNLNRTVDLPARRQLMAR